MDQNLGVAAAGLLADQASAALGECRYREAAAAAGRAVEAARHLDDLVLLARSLRLEASALKMLGDKGAALARYTEILGLAQDPATRAGAMALLTGSLFGRRPPIQSRVNAEIGYRTNSGLGTISPGWGFEQPVTENGEVRYTCFAGVNPQVRDPNPIVRFVDRNGNLYYSYRSYTRRFSQNTDWITAAIEIDKWIRTGPRPDEPDDGQS